MVEPLPERIEFVGKHDPYINGTFIEITDRFKGETFTDDMPDFERALHMMLATNDPEHPSVPTEPAFKPTPSRSKDPEDAMVVTDEDGDKMTVAYNPEKGAIVFKTSPRGFYLSMVKVPGMVKWLLSRKAKHENGGEAVAK